MKFQVGKGTNKSNNLPEPHLEADLELQKEFNRVEASVTDEYLKYHYDYKRKKFRRYPIVEGHKDSVSVLPRCPNCCYEG